MAKKFSKFLAFATLAGVAAAGIYYYLNKKDDTHCNCKDDDIETFFDDEKEKAASNREYVSLNKSASDSKETIKNVVTEAAEELKEKAAEAADGVGIVKDASKEASEFSFQEFNSNEKSEDK